MKNITINCQTYHFSPLPRQQQGAVLLMSLILLIILTLLGISAMESTKMETRMAANMTEYNRALQIAEVGVFTPLNFYLGNNMAQLANIPEQGSTPPNTLMVGQGGNLGKVTYTLRKSSTSRPLGSLKRSYFIIESTGYSNTDEHQSLQVQLSAGMVLDVGQNTNLLVD